jgi:murein DD-endopeptidase MepM/ murein hydrolase activator NlpD
MSPAHTPTRARRLAALLALAAAAVAVAAPAAPAQDGPEPEATGGLVVPGKPVVSTALCANQRSWTCARGQVLTLRGDDLSAARAVIYLGGADDGDDVRVPLGPRAAQAGELLTIVPRRARSGPLKIVTALGTATETEQDLSVVDDIPGIDDARRLTKLVAGGRRPAVFRYRLEDAPATGAAVEAVRVSDGRVVRRWPLEREDDATGEVRWDGYVGDEPARTGTYVLRLNRGGEAAASAVGDASPQFDLLEALFPIRGRHTIGRTETQRFGGARDHQGHDVFARCGTPLAALSKGVVHFTGAHGRAGNYVVVNTPSGESYAYMHLRDAPLVRKGQRVFAGQRLGYVGDTGRAFGCHLHIELWTAPGWYQGGRPRDPFADLVRWDAWS